jgi:hypothetical protein
MDAQELRALQAPIKEKYKNEPQAAVITLKAQGTLEDAKIGCKVETGQALALAGLHPATGGSGAELCSGDMLLEALVAAIDVPLRKATVKQKAILIFAGRSGSTRKCPLVFALSAFRSKSRAMRRKKNSISLSN